MRVFVVLLFFAVAGITAADELAERDATIKTLTESLAIARTESELFQKLWTEAQLRAQTLGVGPTDSTQRQLVESLRSLYLAEAERQRLIEQLNRLLAAVQTGQNVTGEVERAKALLAAEKPVSQPASQSSLETARVLEFNSKLRLVVLDVGSLQGARVGMPFIVLRGDRVIAWARVVEVRQKICGALIEKTEGNVAVKAGDSASVTKS